MILRRELAEHLVEQGFIISHQLALSLALHGIAERIERRAAQELELREQSEHWEDPGAERDLARLARDLVLARQERRGPLSAGAATLPAEPDSCLAYARVVRVKPPPPLLVPRGQQPGHGATRRLGS